MTSEKTCDINSPPSLKRIKMGGRMTRGRVMIRGLFATNRLNCQLSTGIMKDLSRIPKRWSFVMNGARAMLAVETPLFSNHCSQASARKPQGCQEVGLPLLLFPQQIHSAVSCCWSGAVSLVWLSVLAVIVAHVSCVTSCESLSEISMGLLADVCINPKHALCITRCP